MAINPHPYEEEGLQAMEPITHFVYHWDESKTRWYYRKQQIGTSSLAVIQELAEGLGEGYYFVIPADPICSKELSPIIYKVTTKPQISAVGPAAV